MPQQFHTKNKILKTSG